MKPQNRQFVKEFLSLIAVSVNEGSLTHQFRLFVELIFTGGGILGEVGIERVATW